MAIQSIAKYVTANDEVYVVGVFDGSIQRMRLSNPYFYVYTSDKAKIAKAKEVEYYEDTDLRVRSTERGVVKVVVRVPGDVERLTKSFGKYIQMFENDIPYVRRMLTDKELEVQYSRDNIVYLDIELDDSKGMPIHYGKYKIVCVGCYNANGEGEWFYIGDYVHEREMLQEWLDWMIANNKTIIAGWNVGFDYNHLIERCKVLGIDCKWLKFCHAIDLMPYYKDVVKGLESYSLEEVSEYEGWKKKERSKMIHEMTRTELEEYNMYDAELCYLIDERYGFVDLKIEMANELNLTIENLTPVRIGDSLIIRRLRELWYVAETINKSAKKGYEGAYVKEPKPGIYDAVLYLDYTSLYPNIIINEKIDIEGFNGEVLPYIEQEFLRKRKYYKELYKETGERKYYVKQQVYKVTANAMYGCVGCKYFRYFKEETAGKITAKAREIAKTTEKYIEEKWGFTVVYIDTDGVFIHVGKDKVIGDIEKFAELLANDITEFIAPYEIKIEKVFDKIIFVGSERKGTKKRYVGIDKDGNITWRGLEVRRADYPRLVKETLHKVVEMMFSGKSKEEIMAWLMDVKRRMWTGEYDDELVIVKSVKNIEEYKANQPHIRALKMALKRGYKPIDGRIRFVWYGKDVLPIITEKDLERIRGKLNYYKYWEMIKNVTDRLISVYGVSRQISLM